MHDIQSILPSCWVTCRYNIGRHTAWVTEISFTSTAKHVTVSVSTDSDAAQAVRLTGRLQSMTRAGPLQLPSALRLASACVGQAAGGRSAGLPGGG